MRHTTSTARGHGLSQMTATGRLLTFIYVILGCMTAAAQELRVVSMQPTIDIITADKQRLDLVGDPCAVVKVQLPVSGVKFHGSIVGEPVFDVNTYWVYMPMMTKELEVECPGHYTLEVRFADYGIPELESKRVYRLRLEADPRAISQQADLPKLEITAPTYNGEVKTFMANDVIFNMVYVQGGTFVMGATTEQSDARDNERPAHQVTLGDYMIAETEVTQELWQAIMGSNPSKWHGANLPVECVSWDSCQEFIARLNAATGLNFALPTEAQWEYAARGGSLSQGHRYAGAADTEQLAGCAWFKPNSGHRTHVVASKQPNELGLYDMAGNVWEWCADPMGPYPSTAVTDPAGPSSGAEHVSRGGSWVDTDGYCRLTFRNSNTPQSRYTNLGLRLALLPQP